MRAQVHNDVVPLFSKTAEELISSKGAVEALSRALAEIAGFTQPVKTRSLLLSAQGGCRPLSPESSRMSVLACLRPQR